MIAVIADDLTGAAELAGIGLRFGLTVEITFEVDPSSKPDLLVISADTRSKTEAEAVLAMAMLTKAIASLQPKFIYKKVDSVLRGHVVAELEAQLQALNSSTVFLIPANPALGRTIENGVYYIHGAAINETSFKDDPEFPAKSSNILEMLAAKDATLSVQKSCEKIDSSGIIVGEASSEADLKEWALRLKDSFFVAGGGGLFAALLPKLIAGKPSDIAPAKDFSGNKLYVSGTTFKSSSERVAALVAHKGLVNYLPLALLSASCTKRDIDSFAVHVTGQINKNGTAVMAIDPNKRRQNDILATQVSDRTALIVDEVLRNARVDELIIEGGSTAASVLAVLGIRKLFPTNEYAPGVIRSRSGEELYITLKPGSYNWPAEVWAF